MRLALAALSAFVLSALLTPLARSLARRFGYVAVPRPDRWHQRPTALLGGVAVYVASMTAWLIWVPNPLGLWPILTAASAMMVLGLIDDLVLVKVYVKLVVQILAGAALVAAGLSLPWTPYVLVNDLATIFWIVGITNAINLLDNMDGLAAGVTAIAALSSMATFLMSGQTAEAYIPAMVAGASLGFLIYNFNPATIFMGDSGALFLGFTLAATTLQSNYGRGRQLASVLLVPVLILMIPILDTILVTITRKMSGREISQGGRDHTSHRLVALGLSERQAVLGLYLLAAVSGGFALLVRPLQTDLLLLLIPAFGLAMVFLAIHVGKVRVYESVDPPKGNTVITALAEFSQKRRVFEISLDLVLISMAYYGAFVIRFDGDIPLPQIRFLLTSLPFVIILEMVVFLFAGVYRGLWRHVGVDEALRIAVAVFGGGTVAAIGVLAAHHFTGPSRAALILNPILLFVAVGASRFSFRVLGEWFGRRRHATGGGRKVLIYGAGHRGELLIRELLGRADSGMVPVGFLDDDIRKDGRLLHGYPIFSSHRVLDIAGKYQVTDVILSEPDPSQSVLDKLRAAGIAQRRLTLQIE